MSMRAMIAAVLSALMLSGCATMIRGTTQQVSINTDPPGATVTTSTGQSCTSPCLFEAERKNTLQVTVEKTGCNTYTSAMIPTLAGAGAIWGGIVHQAHLCRKLDSAGRRADSVDAQPSAGATGSHFQRPTPSARAGTPAPV